jgi:tripartite-type tricarboxylate transporter receptor subunit TctC
MAMELFKLESNTFMLHVPYRGSAGYTQDLLGGELNVGFLPVHIAQGFVKNGRLNALAVGSPKRHPVAPDVPTFDEVGVKRVDVDLWYAFFVPSKTPGAVVSRLNTEMAAILRQNDVKDILGKAGMDAVPSTPGELAVISAKDYPRWGAVIRTKQISAD